MDSETFRVENPILHLTLVDFIDGKLVVKYINSDEIDTSFDLSNFKRDIESVLGWYERNWTKRAKLAFEMLK